MSKIKDNNYYPGKPRGWMRPTLITLLMMAILAVLVILQPWNAFMGNQNVINKMSAAGKEVKAYRFSNTSQTLDVSTGNISTTITEGARELPDKIYEKIAYDKPVGNGWTTMETIVINGTLYIKYDQGDWSVAPWSTNAVTLSNPGDMLNKFKALKGTQALPDEQIDGVLCFHYKSVTDYGDMKWSRSGSSITPDEKLKSAATVTMDVWAGKDDYLPRRISISSEFLKDPKELFEPSSQIGISDIYDYHYDNSIRIEPPVYK